MRERARPASSTLADSSVTSSSESADRCAECGSLEAAAWCAARELLDAAALVGGRELLDAAALVGRRWLLVMVASVSGRELLEAAVDRVELVVGCELRDAAVLPVGSRLFCAGAALNL